MMFSIVLAALLRTQVAAAGSCVAPKYQPVVLEVGKPLVLDPGTPWILLVADSKESECGR